MDEVKKSFNYQLDLNKKNGAKLFQIAIQYAFIALEHLFHTKWMLTFVLNFPYQATNVKLQATSVHRNKVFPRWAWIYLFPDRWAASRLDIGNCFTHLTVQTTNCFVAIHFETSKKRWVKTRIFYRNKLCQN